MKKAQLILFLLIGMITFSSCSDDDKQPNLKFGDLPLSSQEFLTQYFPNNSVVAISFDSPPTVASSRSTGGSIGQETAYTYVLLEGNINVAFSRHSGNWTGISAANGIPLSATKILDEYVYQRLVEKESQAEITTLTPFYDHSITIALDNGHGYAQTQRLVYSGTTLAEASITNNEVVTKITDFVTRNQIVLPNTTGKVFKITETEGTAYRLFMGDALVISFDENVDWIHAEVNDDKSNTSAAVQLLSKIAKNEMPASVAEAISNTQSNFGGIRIIAVYGSGNYGLRFKNKDLLVNETTGVVPPPIAKANGVMSRHYDSSYKPRESFNGGTLVGAYEYFTSFYYVKDEKTVGIEVTASGDWIHINEIIVENGKAVSISLPSTIVNELPALAAKYLEENYKDKDIYWLSHNRYIKGYVVYVDKRFQINFNEDGSFKSMIEIWY